MTIPYITKEQCLAMFDHHGLDATLRELNRRISVVNELAEQATQDQFISAKEAEALGAGNAEFFGEDDHRWYECDKGCRYVHSIYGSPIKYRAIRKEVTQYQFISAKEAEALGAGHVEFFNPTSKKWEVCHGESELDIFPLPCAYLANFKYRAIRKEVPAEPQVILDPAIREGVIALLQELGLISHSERPTWRYL